MKKRTKTILICTGIALVAVFLLVLLGRATQGFQNWNTDEWKLKQPNPDNLYHGASFLDDKGVIANGSDGISIKIDEDDNSIKVKGTAETDKEYAVALVNLKAGTTYAFDGSLTNGSNKTMYLSLQAVSGGATLANSYSGPVLFTVESDTQAHLIISVGEETNVNLTLKPILCVSNDVDDLVGYYK